MVPIEKTNSIATVKIPAELNALNAIRFNKELNALPCSNGYSFDFTGLRFARPYAMLFLAQAFREFRQKHNSNDRCKALIPNNMCIASACSYMAHMGFFRDAGIKFGKDTGQASGGKNYIPITEINFHELCRKDRYREMQDILQDAAKELASILVQTNVNDAHEVLSYCMREILRNAYEHSKSNRVRICAQYWPRSQRAQIAILDSGIGILTSLKGASQFNDLPYDTDALDAAVKPGVSSNPLINSSHNNPWANSGFGLYMLKRICKDSGSLLISSNKAVINIEERQTAWSHAGLNGTSLKVEIDLKKLRSLGTLNENLERYRNESNTKTKPSRSSMGLSR